MSLARALGVDEGGPCLAVCLAFCLALCPAPAANAAPPWLHAILAGRLGAPRKSPPVARYALDSGGDFVLDSGGAGGKALLKFQDGFEVWALSLSRGPRGDLIYWNDVRQPMLRTTRMGGVTVFTPHRPDGAAATLLGPGSPLRIGTIGVASLYSRLVQAAARSSRAAAHTIAFEAPNADAGSDGLIADCAFVTSEAIVLAAARPAARGALSRLTRVVIQPGREAAVAFKGATLTVQVEPKAGYAGRPSSLRIVEAFAVR